MPSYVPPKKGVEYIFYISLASQANANTFQSNPTLAAGDFKVSIDGGALANPATLPTVTPASGKLVKVTLSTSEMNGDNIIFIASDAAGAEWRDLTVCIQTSARQVDDLAYPTTSGRSIDVTTTGEVGIDWANIGSPTTTQTLSGTTVKTATDVETDTADIQSRLPAALVSGRIDASAGAVASGAITATAIAADAIGASELASDAVTEIAAGVWDRLTSALTTVGSAGKLLVDNVNATISSRATQTSVDTVDDFLDTEIAAIKAKTDNLPADPADESSIQAAITALNDITVADILAGTVEGSLDLQESLKLILSVLTGKSSGGGTTTVAFRDVADTKDRVSATVDGDGNRTAVTLDAS